MIIKELITTQDGRTLYKTYSNTDHKIKQVTSGKIYAEAIDIAEDVSYVETDEMLNTIYDYAELQEMTKRNEQIASEINRISLTDNEALSVMDLYPTWESRVGKITDVGYITKYDGKLWRTRQTHVPLAIYPPSINTASLYEVIEVEHTGTIDDPIPYVPPMEIYKDKYYTEDGVMYLCTRDTGIVISHQLKDVVNIYVSLV